MAELHALHPLRYTPGVAGALGDLVAPPYDVIDAEGRAALLARNPHNAVHLELPDPPYEQVGALVAAWVATGVLARTERPGVVAWTQAFALPDGTRHERRVILAAVRAEPYATRQVRPHERTHSGPKEDRLKLLYGAGHQISPVYGLYPDAQGAVWQAIDDASAADVSAFTTDDGTHNRVWWVDDPAALDAAAELMDSRWILIADGHHRYETAVRFAQERRDGGAGAGPHELVMMGLTAFEDPGLVVLPTHRVLAAAPVNVAEGFTVAAVPDLDTLQLTLRAAPLDAPAFGLVRPSGAAVLTAPAVPDASPAARLDVAVLEQRVFRRHYDRDQAALAHDGVLTYVKDAAEAWQLGTSGAAAAVFILRDLPKQAVMDVAEAGETMPQKSTYFFPKLSTGVAFHPLA